MSGRGGYNQRPWRGRGNRGSRGFRGSRYSYGYGPPDRRREFHDNSRSNWKNDQKPAAPVKGLTEKDIGVTEYVSKHNGFNGIIKSRFSDFQVAEVNEKGEIAKLTDLSSPEPPIEASILEDEELLLNKYNLEILPMETWDRINKLTTCTGPDYDTIEVDVTGMSKDVRTKIHDAVKKAFGDSIVGSTITRDDKKYCTFVKYRKGVRVDNRVKWVWPGEYVHFIVYKENCDTMDAASRIIRQLRMNSSLKPTIVGYAGTKDRRAKTSQWFSLRKVDPRKIVAACKGLHDVKVGNFTFSNDHLKLGMLQGNRFRICLRNVTAGEEEISRACTLLSERGFVNYFGLQRFGSQAAAPTHRVGLQLLRGDFEQAIRCILEQRPGPLAEALRAFHTNGPAAALELLPRRATSCTAETRLLAALALQPRDLARALDTVPRNTRLLYLHSYQSLIWNKVVSERLQRFSHSPVVGDLVPLEEIEEETVETADDANADEDMEQDNTNKKQENDVVKKTPKVKVLTQEDIDSNKYTMFDVVLPLPGHSVKYPPNVKELYEQLLTSDGLTLEMKHKQKAYSLSGSYRRVCVRPTDMSWRSARYSQPLADLLLSDLELIRGNTDTGECEDGKYKALIITMTLPPSCYATMALRELLRVDTSSNTQAQQNDYHKSKETDIEENNVKQENNVKHGDGDNVSSGDIPSGNVNSEVDVVKSEDNAEKRKGDEGSDDGGDCKKVKLTDE